MISEKWRKLWERFQDKFYRDEYASINISNSLAAQIYFMRDQRGWTQSDLAEKTGIKELRISKLEESCEGVSITTLKKLASAFDVALDMKFVPFSQIISEMDDEALDRTIVPFDQDRISPQ